MYFILNFKQHKEHQFKNERKLLQIEGFTFKRKEQKGL